MCLLAIIDIFGKVKCLFLSTLKYGVVPILLSCQVYIFCIQFLYQRCGLQILPPKLLLFIFLMVIFVVKKFFILIVHYHFLEQIMLWLLYLKNLQLEITKNFS